MASWEDGLALVGYRVRHKSGLYEGRILGRGRDRPHVLPGRWWRIEWAGEHTVADWPESLLILLPLHPKPTEKRVYEGSHGLEMWLILPDGTELSFEDRIEKLSIPRTKRVRVTVEVLETDDGGERDAKNG